MVGAIFAACNNQPAAPTTPATPAPGGDAAAPADTGGADRWSPSRPIEAIHQMGPGGGFDLFVRAIGHDAGTILGTTVVPIAAQGGAGLVALDRVMAAPADGHTIYVVGPEQIFMDIWGQMDLFEEFTPLLRAQHDVGFLSVRTSDDRFDSIDDVMAYAIANPGALNIAITNPASYDDVVVNLWASLAGIEVSIVPYASGSEAIAALMGGHVHVLFEEIGPKRGFIDSGDFTPVLAFIEDRITQYEFVAHVPTTYELGWEVALGRWRGMMVRYGTDPEIIQVLFEAMAESMQGETYLAHEYESLLDIRPGLLNPEEFRAFLEAELAAYRPVIYALDMFPD